MCADSGIKRFRKDNYDIIYYYDSNKELITIEYFDNIMCATYKNHFTKDKFNMNLKFINNLLLKYFEEYEEYEDTINDELKIEGNKLYLSLICFHEFGDFKFDFELIKCNIDDKKTDKILMNKRIKMLEDKNEILRNKIEKLQEIISSCSLDIEIYDNKYVKSDTTDLFLSEFSYKHTNNNNQDSFQSVSCKNRDDGIHPIIFRLSRFGGCILNKKIFKYGLPHKYQESNGLANGKYISEGCLIRCRIQKENKKKEELEHVKWNFEKLNFLNLNFLCVDCLVCDFKLEYVPETVKILYLVDYQEVSLSKKDMESLLNKCCLLEDIILQNTTYKNVSFCNLKNCYDAIEDNLDINFTFVSMNYLKDGKLENLSNVNFED